MTEYITWLRGQVGPALLPLAYVTGIVRDAAGRVLFQRRTDFGAAWWGLPGGLFEPGETPAACLCREVLEETGLRVEPRRWPAYIPVCATAWLTQTATRFSR